MNRRQKSRYEGWTLDQLVQEYTREIGYNPLNEDTATTREEIIEMLAALHETQDALDAAPIKEART